MASVLRNVCLVAMYDCNGKSCGRNSGGSCSGDDGGVGGGGCYGSGFVGGCGGESVRKLQCSGLSRLIGAHGV